MDTLVYLTSTSTPANESNQSSGAIDKLISVFKNPILYIVVGVLIIFILIIYLLRRFTRANPGFAVVITRKGKIRKILTESDKTYYRVPFIDSIGAVILLNSKSFVSEKLFINNGPDHLYKINYTFIYGITNIGLFFENLDGIQNKIEKQINDRLRLFADNGNASTIIKEYRSEEKTFLSIINEVINQYGIEAQSFSVNYIEPIGKWFLRD